MRTAVIKIFFLLFLSVFLYGNIYFWTDKNGIKQFSNISPPLDEAVEELPESPGVINERIARENDNQMFRVLKIFDGDTIQVSGLDLTFTIRLVGIDSPETGFKGQASQPFSQKAKQYLKHLLDTQTVHLKSYGTGGYNRQLAEVFVGEKNINIEMLRAGLAEVYKGTPPKQLDLKGYRTAEASARRAEKGIWSQGRSYTSPKQWRKDHPRK
ncbi:thermonuclease family protein [Desulfobacula sp.]|uniref:thermonuclease family protein n=1 Tax=Desulfobacula sp. TaxID=2593537 RepID=UPI002622B897|nr:thermonuclease family protein [Desulfobacula sp.]